MFVKIIRAKRKDDAAQIEKTYECDRYETRFWRQDTNTGDRVCLIIMTRNGQDQAAEIGEGDGAFFMNENGRTIDSIDWRDHRVDEAVPIKETTSVSVPIT